MTTISTVSMKISSRMTVLLFFLSVVLMAAFTFFASCKSGGSRTKYVNVNDGDYEKLRQAARDEDC